MSILDESATIVGDRDTQYGTPERNLGRISEMWSAYTGAAISPRDVAIMMILLKCSREATKPKRDNLVDIAGYAALAAQLGDTDA